MAGPRLELKVAVWTDGQRLAWSGLFWGFSSPGNIKGSLALLSQVSQVIKFYYSGIFRIVTAQRRKMPQQKRQATEETTDGQAEGTRGRKAVAGGVCPRKGAGGPSSPKAKQNQISVYDFTFKAEDFDEHAEVGAWLRKFCKNWVYQLEKGAETGYLHYQARVSLMVKRRPCEMIANWAAISEGMPKPHITPTSTAASTSFCYVMKGDTRVEGPWSDKDKVVYIPRQYRGMEKTLMPWQQKVWDSADDFEPRKINYVYCQTGNKGKTVIASLMELHDRGIDLPPVNDQKELVQSTCDILEATDNREPKTVFIDMPRAMHKDKLNGIFSAIEQIKKGKVYDLRYKYKAWWFDSPQVWVFSNTLAATEMLSRDRWLIWTITEDMELVPYVPSYPADFEFREVSI